MKFLPHKPFLLLNQHLNIKKTKESIFALIRYLSIHDKFILSFEEDTPIELIKSIKPDTIVKGGDYKPGDVVGADVSPGKTPDPLYATSPEQDIIGA